jgi:hypothetical protein
LSVQITVVHHRRAVAERARLRYRVDALLHRHGFPGQQGLVDVEALARDEAAVRGDAVALAHDEQVAGDHLLRRDVELPPVADDVRAAANALAERADGPLSTRLLDEAEHPVEQDDGPDRGGLDAVADRGRDRGCRDEQADERIRELAAGDARVRGARRPARRVRPVPHQARGRLGRARARLGIGAQPGRDLPDRNRVRGRLTP